MNPRTQKLIFFFTFASLILFLIIIPSHILAKKAEPVAKINVETIGQAPLEADRGMTKEKALKDAFRNALEKALGVRITSTTVMEDLIISTDLVISQAWGHLLSYEIQEEWEFAGQYHVQISAVVSPDAQSWANYSGSIDQTRLYVKDLVYTESYQLTGQIQPGSIYQDKILVIPIKDNKYYLKGINTENNQNIWTFTLSAKLTAPLVSDGNWLIAVTSKEIISINLHYGWTNWTFSLTESVHQPPALTADALYFTTKKGLFIALSLEKGKMLWKYNSQNYFLNAVTVAGERAYFSDGSGYLHALNLPRKSRDFKILIAPELKAGPTATEVLTYLNWNDGHDQITGLNSVDGEKIWSYQGQTSQADSVLAPYIIGNKIIAVFTARSETRIYLFDALSGYKYWEKKLDVTTIDITGADNHLIILNTWQGIRILDLEYGNLLWETSASGLQSEVVLGDNRLYYLHHQEVDVYE